MADHFEATARFIAYDAEPEPRQTVGHVTCVVAEERSREGAPALGQSSEDQSSIRVAFGARRPDDASHRSLHRLNAIDARRSHRGGYSRKRWLGRATAGKRPRQF